MNTPKLTELFEAALVYTHQLHRHQTRKARGTPYIAHLLSVTALVLEAGGSEDEALTQPFSTTRWRIKADKPLAKKSNSALTRQ